MNRLDWTGIALDHIACDGATVLITQCSVEGSAPRDAGTKMLVSASQTVGTIGGGNLEFQAIRQATLLLERRDVPHLIQDYPLGPLLQQCCGGHVRLLLERLDSDDIDWLRTLQASKDEHRALVLETQLDGRKPRKRLRPLNSSPHQDTENFISAFTDKSGSIIERPRPPRDICAGFIERTEEIPPVIMLYGAGHVGQAIAHVLSISDFPLRWFDNRPDYIGETKGINIALLTDPDRLAEDAPSRAIHLILTHDHDLDYRLVRAILQRGEFIFCGLIGSRTKRARFIRRLKDDGISAAAISRLTCPIGGPEVTGKTPAAIAVAVASQLFQLYSHPTAGEGASLEETQHNQRQTNSVEP